MNLTETNAQEFAQDWIAAWNAHDVEAVLNHYADDVEFASPFVVKLLDEETGTIFGRERLRQYFSKGLEAFPALSFELLGVLVGVEGLTLRYRSVEDREAVEVLTLDQHGSISRAHVYYALG
jgi:hypothetical protein